VSHVELLRNVLQYRGHVASRTTSVRSRLSQDDGKSGEGMSRLDQNSSENEKKGNRQIICHKLLKQCSHDTKKASSKHLRHVHSDAQWVGSVLPGPS
jgi:hypothetical protein